MVFVAAGGGSTSGSDQEFSNESDLSDSHFDTLAEQIIGKLSLYQSPYQNQMTIKNRKDKLKPDRASDRDSPGTSANSKHNYSYKPYSYSERRKDSLINRNHAPHTNTPSKDIDTSRSRAFPPYPLTENPIYQSPTTFPLLPVTQGLEVLTTNRDCDVPQIQVAPHSPVPDDKSGNNSEDEYYFGKQSHRMASIKVTEIKKELTFQTTGENLEQMLMEKKGWKIVKVAEDAHQIFGDEEKNDVVRTQVIDYMVKNKEHFSQYLTEDFDHYITRKRDNTCHGNHVEIQAIAELYNRPVEIYHDSVEPINVFHADYSKEFPIRLSYHGHVHYNSVIDPFNPTFGHGLGMPNYQPSLAEPDLIAHAIRESETTHLEEALLQGKLAETEQDEIEQCIEDQIVRNSYYDFVNNAPVKSNKTDKTETAAHSSSPPNSSSSKPYLPPVIKHDVASSSKTSLSNPSHRDNPTCLNSEEQSRLSHSDKNSVLLEHMPANLLGMEEDAVIAMVMEQSRQEYLENLRSKQKQSTEYVYDNQSDPPTSPRSHHQLQASNSQRQ